MKDGKKNSEKPSTPGRFVRDIATLLLSLTGGASVTKLAPPEGYRGLVWFVVFGVSGAAWLIGVLLSRKWDRAMKLVEHIKKSLLIAIRTLVFFIVAAVLYIVQRDAFTTPYPSGQETNRVVTGWSLTEQGKKYFSENPGATRETAVMAAGGSSSAVWTSWSLALSRASLWLNFFAVLFGGTFTIVFGSDLMSVYGKSR
jgi:hypothetical protein